MSGTRVGFIGLGAMGAGMSRQLLAAGFDVHGYDVQSEPVAELGAAGGVAAATPAEAADGASLLFVVVFTAAQAEQVLFGEHGAATTLVAGATVVNHATTSPEQAKGLESRCAAAGFLFVDAPVTGGKSGADEGTLTVIASGSEAAMAAAQPALQAMSRRVYNCGSSAGAGSTVKMANQMLVGVHAVAAAEAISLARKGGADPAVVHEVLTNGHGNSLVWEQWVPKMLEGDFEGMGKTGLAIMRKDLGIATGAPSFTPSLGRRRVRDACYLTKWCRFVPLSLLSDKL